MVKTVSKTPEANFEERMKRLEEVTSALENAEIPLEASVALYKEGLELAKSCRSMLEKARHEVLAHSEGGLKNFVLPEEDE